MQVITLETPSLGDRSYVVHDGSTALVIDPQRDVDRVLDALDTAGVEVSHVAETHLHNDYVSGGLVLARMTGAEYLHAAGEDVRVDHRPVADGDTLAVGRLTVEVLHTPGHTAHHLSFVVRDGDEAPAVFTGGSLLYGTVGRTDLISADATEGLTRAQYWSAHRLVDLLPADTRVYPTHGFGSFCSSAESPGTSDGTLGGEREINVAFTSGSEDRFVEELVAGLSAHPAYYVHMAPLNSAGPGWADLSPAMPVDPVELARRIHAGEWVVDLRDRRAYAADHLEGAIGIELADPFATYLGWLIPWGMPLTLLADTADQLAEAQRQLVRIGIDRPAGASHGGIDAWAGDGRRRSYRVADFRALAERRDGHAATVLDVRRHDEWSERHVVGAVNVPIHELLDRLADVPAGEVWVHCTTGFRASIAASLLDRAGRQVVLIDDEFANAPVSQLSAG